MNARQWARVKETFHAALDRGQDERADFVAHACADDPALKLEVERLLAAHHEAGRFLAEPPAGTLAAGSMTGQVLGRYEIGRIIGSGGMGEVYAARDVELKRDVAIKFALLQDDGARLRREAQHTSRLNHPHICTIHEVGSSDGRAFIVMEYVTGDRLCDVIPPQGLPVDNVLRYGAQIADALAHAHDNGVTHRDLKSANVMVSKAGRTKVLDFGIARATAPPADSTETTERPATITAPGVVMGTVAYMSPELLRGEPANAASDIWALGVILYEMVNGAQPFSGATGFEVTGAILHAQPPPLRAGIPALFDQIIMRCLAKDPASRYATAHEVRAALDAATTVSISRTRLSWRRAALAAGVITAVVASVIVWRSSRTPDTIGVGAAGRPAIAVMAFDNLAGGQDTAWLSQGIPSMLMTGLAQTRGLDIVSAQRLREAVRQFGGTGLETLPRDQFARIAQRAGAGAIVVGGISRAGPEIRIDAHLEDLTTGRVLAAQSVRGSDLFLLVDQLAARIRDDIGLQATDEIRRVSEISTGSIEAFQLYSQGVDAFINYHWEEARTLLERAVGIDPGFADAYLHLSFANFFLGNHALQAQNLRKASEHASRLSARRRLVLDVELARDGGDGPAAARTLDELIRRFPDDEDAYNLAALLYDPLTGLINDSQKYLIIAARGAAAVPKSTLLRNLYAYTLLYVGRHEEAVTEFENNVRLASREPNSYDSLGEAYLVTGRPAKAIESYGQALAIDPGFLGSHLGRAWAFAMLGQFESALSEQARPGVQAFILSRVGRFREAGQLLEQARRDAVKAGNSEEQGQLDLVSAMLAIERSDYRRAVQECDAAERVLAGLPKSRQRMRLALLHVLKGTALVRTGTIGHARTQLATVAVLHNPGVEAEHYWFKALEGEIALAAGDVAGAAAAFTAGQPARKMSFESLYMSLSIVTNNLTSRDGLARVARMQGDSARAIEIYRQLLSTGPEQKFVSAFNPHYVLEIARLLDGTGDRPGASTEYNRFLELWERADIDAPELGEARRAIRRLSAAATIPSPRATASVAR